VAAVDDAPRHLIDGVAAEAARLETPCGDGGMVWHVWGSGPPLVLLHGGYGSWTHWIRNVLPLSRSFTVVAPDLPGLGESATPPEPHTAEGLARILVAGLDIVLPRHEPLHLAGFSFGGVLGGHVAALLGERVRAFTVVGSNGLGLVRQPTDLRRVPADASAAEILAVARHNLGQLMIADPTRSTRSRSTSRRRTRRAAGSRAAASRAPIRSPAPCH
jgi:2-hydroxy-6-oxonona-2,4-dienedioate hydrolase